MNGTANGDALDPQRTKFDLRRTDLIYRLCLRAVHNSIGNLLSQSAHHSPWVGLTDSTKVSHWPSLQVGLTSCRSRPNQNLQLPIGARRQVFG
jgi:hypothetical protein